ncbi:MAG TPA: alpha/beta hydrolase [Alphaproteobacteria bacterium]|nr:alpha/beta hydrolase [Alphaproteobacteria bacterium]
MTTIPPSIDARAAVAEWVDGCEGTRLRFYRIFGPVEEGPVLLWGHANGFAAGSYLPWLQRVAERMPVFAFDARGHGGSEQPPAPYTESCRVDVLARDLALVVQRLRMSVGPDRPIHFAAHSFTGLAALRLGGVLGEIPWASATLLEPPLSPPPEYPAHSIAAELAQALVATAERRRAKWASPQAFIDRLAGAAAYAKWDPGMLAAHCHATLRPNSEDSGYVLACDPAVEAAGYRMTMNTSTFCYVDRFCCATTFIASEAAGKTATPSWAAQVQGLAAARVPGAKLVRMAGTGHMMVFEKPDQCLQALFASIEGADDG